jgi:hypothetical protein
MARTPCYAWILIFDAALSDAKQDTLASKQRKMRMRMGVMVSESIPISPTRARARKSACARQRSQAACVRDVSQAHSRQA